MKMMETKESASASIPRGRGRGNPGCSRGGRGGGRGGGGRIPSSARGGRSNHNNRHPRSTNSNNDNTRNKQHQTKQNHRGGRGGGGGRGRPRSSSYNKSDGGASTVKKRTGPYAHLFCSERHGFALSRVFYPRNNDQFLLPTNVKEENNSNATSNSNNTRIASDSQMENWWEAVKLVRCHVPHNETTDTNERCPICLDEEMISPYIAPCGHKFCLPCVLGYLNSIATELNEESDRIKKNKQQNVKSNSGIVGCSKLTGRASVTSIRARCPMCSSGSSMELKSGEAVITYKDLRPVVFVPVLAIAAATEEVSSNKGKKGNNHHNSRMRFVKLHRTQQCPAPYLPLAGHRIRGRTSIFSHPSTITESSLPDIPDGDDDREECNYTRQYFVGVEEYENILQRDLDDLNNYRQTQYCKMDPREDWNVAMSIEAVQASQRRWVGSSGNDGGFRAMEIEAKATTGVASDQLLTKEASDSITNEEDTKPQVKSPKKSALLQPGSFHLHQKSDSNSANCSSQGDAEEFLFYQSSDGQLCFLSGINVACLMHEFSLHRRVEDTAKDDNTINDNVSPSTDHDQQPNAQLPLPDELTATVVAIEELVVTTSLIKRKHFLAHIPIGTSVYFAEIDMYSGGDGGNKPLLSHNTLSKFKGELQRRKSERLRALKREHKADNVARAKAAKDDQRRLRELLGSHYVEGAAQQQIDPDDEFFRQAAFDEEVLPSPTFRFNEVCATGGVWPELNLSGNEDTVSTSASPVQSPPNAVTPQSSLQTTTTSWGKVVSTPKVVVNSFPSLSESLATHKSQSEGSKRGPWRS